MKLQQLIALGILGGGGLPPEPVATVTGNGVTIPDGDVTPSAGDNTDFGLTPALTTVSKTYNIAVATANLTGVSVVLSGAGAGGYTITDQPSASINAGANSNFTIRFDALTPIVYPATVTISSNELDDITFAITASALYSARVLATTGVFQYLQLNETSGTAIADSSPELNNAVASGITLAQDAPPQLGLAPSWDATNDKINNFSAGLASDFNFNELTVTIWFKVRAASVWTDATQRILFALIGNGSNRIFCYKSSSNNRIQVSRDQAGVAKICDLTSFSPTTWTCLQYSCSVAGNALLAAGTAKMWVNGVNVGTTATALVSVATALTTAHLGAFDATPTQVWDGFEAHYILHNTAMTSAILALSAV